MAVNIAYIDGVDCDTLGIVLTAIPGPFNAPDTPVRTIKIPGKDGAIITHEHPEVPGRVIEMRALIVADTLPAAEVVRQTVLDATNDRLCALSYGSATDRAIYGVRQSLIGDLRRPGMAVGDLAFALSFFCPDPYFVDTTPQTVAGIATERVSIQVGTGPSWPDITIVGAAVNPSLILRDHTGQIQAQMDFTITLAAGDALMIATTDGGEVRKLVSSVMSNALDTAADGYTFPFVLPGYANRALSSWPTLETSTGSLIATYAKRWR